jgi:hypothetical protein
VLAQEAPDVLNIDVVQGVSAGAIIPH